MRMIFRPLYNKSIVWKKISRNSQRALKVLMIIVQSTPQRMPIKVEVECTASSGREEQHTALPSNVFHNTHGIRLAQSALFPFVDDVPVLQRSP